MNFHYSRFIILFIAVFCAVTTGSKAHAQSLSELMAIKKTQVWSAKKTVFVLAPEILGADDDIWRRGLVGFGLENIVAQKFYDSGHFDISEENPEVVARLEMVCKELGAKIYGKRPAPLPIDREIAADYIVLCRIKSFSTTGNTGNRPGPPRPGGGVSVVGLKRNEASLTVNVELCLFETRTGQRVKQIHSEWKKTDSKWQILATSQTLAWNPSLIGPATEEAVQGAVNQAIQELQPDLRRTATPSEQAFGVPEGPLTLAVMPLGLRPGVEESFPVLVDRRVCMGMTEYITQPLAQTADKSIQLQPFDPGVQEEAAQQYWVAKSGSPRGGDAVEKWKKQNRIESPRWIVYGQLYAFSRTTGEGKGLSGKVQDRLTVGVQLRAVAPALATGAQPRPCIASVTTSVDGDWGKWDAKADDIAWNDSLVEKGLKEAVGAAWKQLFARMKETPFPIAPVTLAATPTVSPAAATADVSPITAELR